MKKFLGSAARRSKRDYASMIANFAAVSESAREKGIFLCIENREHVADLPLESNFCELMAAFAEVPQVRAWHDVGHSMIKQLSGFCKQMEFAESIIGYQAGWHLHDCTENGRDHVAIGSAPSTSARSRGSSTRKSTYSRSNSIPRSPARTPRTL